MSIHVRIVCVLLLLAGWVFAEPAGVDFVRDGKPAATIVLGDAAGPNSAEAAVALQRWVQEMTGAVLPICREVRAPADGTLVLVGPSRLATAAGASCTQDETAPDGYVIKRFDRGLALVGNDAGGLKGSTYAVYDLLWRLGCGWYGPEALWWVIPRKASLAMPELDLAETPAFDMREIWLVERWKSGSDCLADAWRLNGRRISMGHVFFRILPRKELVGLHPDWFGDFQPDMTHPEVITAVTDSFRRILDTRKGFVPLSLTANDGEGFIDEPHNPAIRNASAQNLYICNAVARELRKDYPGRFIISMLAYWATNPPPDPPLKAEPEVCVVFTNHGDMTRAWPEGERNERMVRYFRQWKKTGAQMGIYAYWIPGCWPDSAWSFFPWYPGQNILETQRVWKELGAKYVTYESGTYGETQTFPLRRMLCFVGARGLWGTEQSAEQLLSKACGQLFGPASEEMVAVYNTIAEVEQGLGVPEKRKGASGAKPHSPERAFTPEVEQRIVELLHAAEQKAGGDPTVLARIQEERRLWARAGEVLAKLRQAGSVDKRKLPPTWTPVYYNGRISYTRSGGIDLHQLRRMFNIPPHRRVRRMNNSGEADPFTELTGVVDPRLYWFISPVEKTD